ncbi:vitamin B12-dependent ribonucleotide reductase [Bacillus sp. MCCB 382]|uniref:vitamin B12-dependent ribonucleotide reductase n=1 Tax=Bacillus sp. MCCB 382 TaxID=2860197 RepID=UPI00214C75B0
MTINVKQLNEDIKEFPQVFPVTDDMNKSFSGVSRLIMLDRYTFKDTEKKTLKPGDFVVLTVKTDPKFPARGYGELVSLDWANRTATVKLDESFVGVLEDADEIATGVVTRPIDVVDKPLEIYYEQIAKRNAKGLAAVETDEEARKQAFDDFYEVLVSLDFVPGGRVIYGAGSDTDVTYFNCYVMPYPQDSREGIADHRAKVMEIMSRGGGVGTNGSSLRPKNALAKGVNGKSSGAVSWLDDIAKLTHLVEQGGSRRGAQMIMLADWHPDVIEFIISKMQNPRILRKIIETTKDDEIRRLAKDKLKFEPLSEVERKIYEFIQDEHHEETPVRKEALRLLADGGRYSVNNPEFLTGANISVAITREFMEAVEADADYELRFPDTDNYSEYDKALYDDSWHEYGDVREWEALGFAVKTYRTIKAKELWNLINLCATYSAEPGIFFIDNANDATNAVSYGQKVVATNPCGEQPLAPYSVCNLAAVNLANMKKRNAAGKWEVDYDRLKRTVEVGVRLMDNVITATPYFMEENTKQALGERRLGMGVMGLADLLIYCEEEYGSESGNQLVDHVFEVMATSAYRKSVELAKEKGPFPFLESLEDGHERYINSGYMRKMPEDIRQGVLKHGIRNSHLLTVAPTGSTGSMVGVATGLEPYFSFKYYRSGRLGKFMEVNADIVQEYLAEHPDADPNNLPDYFVSTMALSPEAHVDVQCIIQRWIDSSLSKTVNAPRGYSVEQVEAVYERLYRGGAKGGTVYVDGSRDAQVLSLTAEDNTFDSSDEETPAKVVLVDTINDVRATDVKVGNEVGDTCPVCRKGEVIDAGGCTTCNNCGAQLKCGL